MSQSNKRSEAFDSHAPLSHHELGASLVGSITKEGETSVAVKNKLFEGDNDDDTPDLEPEYEHPFERTKYVICGRSISEKQYMLWLFCTVNLFLFADQNLLAPNLSVIADEFNMTDDERDQYLGGFISIGFFSIGGIVAMVVGYLADTMPRKGVFAATVCIGEISCAATYWVPTESKADFWTGLWLTRAITGFALGGALPIQFSLLGDIFEDDERGWAIALMSIATNFGYSFGQYLANYMSPDFRTPFLIVSLPTFVLVYIFMKTTIEPKRGQAERLLQGQERSDAVEGDHKISWAKLKVLFRTPTAVLVVGQGLFGTLPWGTIGVYANDFLLEEKEQSNSTAANALLMFGLLSGMATLIGGWSVDKFIETHPKYLPLIAGGTTMIGPIVFLIIFKSPPMTPAFYILILIPGGIIAGIAGPIVKGLLIHVTIPETRGTAFALQSLMDELGKGFGPFLVSYIVAASSTREDGLVIGILGWVPCALVMGAIYFFIENDQRKYKLALAEAYDVHLTQAEIAEIEGPKGTQASRDGDDVISV